jgi:hypothetical protein
MAKVVGEVAIDVTADIGPLVREAKKGEAALGGLRGATNRVSHGLRAFGDRSVAVGKSMSVITAGMTAAAGAAFALTKNVASSGDEIAKTARGAGVSGQYFQEMSYALGQVAGISQNELADGMTRVNRLLGEAANGSKTAIAAFDSIGISYDDIAAGAVTSEQAFDKLIQTLSDTQDPALAAAISTQLLGRSGADLGPKLAGASGAIDTLRNRAHDLGVVMSDEALAASEKFSDQLDDVRAGFEGVKYAIANELLPIFVNRLLPAIVDKVIPALHQVVGVVGDVIRWFTDLPEVVQAGAAIIGGVLGAGGPILIGIGLVSKAMGAMLLATGPVGLFIAAAGLLAAAWFKWGDDIKAAVGGAIDWITDKFNGFLEFATSLPAKFIEIGQNIIQGLLDGITARWDALKAKIYELGELLPQWLRERLDIRSPSKVFEEIGTQIGAGLAVGIADSQSMIRAAIAEVSAGAISSTDNMVSGVLSSLGTMFEGSKKFAAAQALVNAWTGATEALKLPFPASLGAFAKVLATGMGAVRSIRATRPGSGSTSGGGAAVRGGASAGGGAPQAPAQTFAFTIQNDPFGIGERTVRQLAAQLNEASRNGANLRVVVA